MYNIVRGENMQSLQKVAKEIRKLTARTIASIGAGHIGGSLSIVDVLTVLYFKHMNVDPKNPKMAGRDRLIVSKGHAGPGVYATLAYKGFFPIEELDTLNKIGTNLPSHCDMNRTKGIDMTTGSLGQGISCAVGIAIASRLARDNAHIYAIVGDGESQEGQVWEAAMYASQQKLDNLIVFLDYNKYQLDGSTCDINDLGNVVDKWKSFGFNTVYIDGHNLEEIDKAIVNAKAHTGSPSMIILNTVKGKGISFAEGAGADSHSMPISKDQLQQAYKELE